MLIDLLQRGGVWYNIAANSVDQFIREAISSIDLPVGCSAASLVDQVLQREASLSTAIGFGIALPHPASLMLNDQTEARVAVVYPRFPLHWPGEPAQVVRAAFFILSANQQQHLETLSALASLCSRESFRTLLQAQAGRLELIEAITSPTKPGDTL